MSIPLSADLIPNTLDGIRAAAQALHSPGLPDQALSDAVEAVITHQITNQPRSLQRTIGPSEIGTDCDHCLAAKLAGWEKTEPGIPWATTVGTAVHELLEKFFNQHLEQKIGSAPPGEGVPLDAVRYWTERKTMVGTIGGQQIWGSTDLLDLVTGSTVDWKLVGKSSLDNYRRKGPSSVYRVQAHLYAKGWNDAGVPIERVSICFLPRTTVRFSDRHWWAEPYQPKVAIDALDRANRIYDNLQALAAISAEVRDQWISSLPRAPRCFDCSRYPDHQNQPAETAGILLDLNRPNTNQ